MAVAAGYEAAVCPSAVEVQGALIAAQTEIADIAGADRAYDQAQNAIATLRPQAGCADPESGGRTALYPGKIDNPAQRRITRTCGAEFRTLPGEEPDVLGTGESVSHLKLQPAILGFDTLF